MEICPYPFEDVDKFDWDMPEQDVRLLILDNCGFKPDAMEDFTEWRGHALDESAPAFDEAPQSVPGTQHPSSNL